LAKSEDTATYFNGHVEEVYINFISLTSILNNGLRNIQSTLPCILNTLFQAFIPFSCTYEHNL